jgi:hypothetical protein
MATHGTAFFDAKGQYFRTPDEATCSDLAAVLGRVGDGDGLAPGIAKTLLEKRAEIEQIFADHDEMMRVKGAAARGAPVLITEAGKKIAALRPTG